MWSKFTGALKTRTDASSSSSSSTGDVMAGIYEQHPNLSVFNEQQPSPPPSPSKSRMNVFRRAADTQHAPSPLKLAKKVFGMHSNSSQLSLGPSTPGPNELSRTNSHDMLSNAAPASYSKRTSSLNALNIFGRSSSDALRSPPSIEQARSPSRAEEPRSVEPTTPFETKSGSVRSILRQQNTPGTGQNVRFFSRDAYHVLSPNQSMESEYQSAVPPTASTTPNPPAETFLDRLQRSASADSTGSGAHFGSAPRSTKTRPSVAEIFSPLASPETSAPRATSPDSSRLDAQLPPIPAPDFQLFDVSQDLDIPMMPPGLGYDNDQHSAKPMTSTPFRDKGKGKELEVAPQLPQSVQEDVDESIFHFRERSPRLHSALHDRSNSFSAGQSLFYSMAQGESKRSSLSSAGGDHSAKSSPGSTKDSSRASSPNIKNRARALSDTVFMSMMRSSSPAKSPEADINDESSPDLIVYAPGAPEPDPFNANGNTYYTLQTLIPITPPKPPVVQAHARQKSNEEQADALVALKAQLALQTELCGQFKTDLRARDELVEVLGKKLEVVEKEESKKRAVLKSWKKKVLELERACRLLEEEVEGSRQESMERSVMDEASGEALRMLHRQIAGLERDKEGAKRLEDMMREEIRGLEDRLRERDGDIEKLKETLETRDESERALKMGISLAKEEMEMLGNVSLGVIDENELRRIAAGENGPSRPRSLEMGEDKRELMLALEKEQEEKAQLAEEVDAYKRRLEDHDEKFLVLKEELENQWAHTEKASEMLETSEAGRREAEKERDALKAELAEMNERLEAMDAELVEADNKLTQDDNDIQELWDIREALETERDELQAQLQDDQERSEVAKQALQASKDRVVELEQERKYALDNVARLEENIRKRDAEVAAYSERILQKEAEMETLREQLSRAKREHAAALAEQSAEAEQEARAALDRIGDLKGEMERLRRQVHQLQQESADKEVKIVQLNKQHGLDKEDISGLNIALDSKQQELELMKRKLGVRGTAGSTPAQSSKIAHQRRDSAVFSTPSLGSRPPSVLSDSGTDGGSASAGKTSALGKSTRLNTSTSKAPTTTRTLGSMGPPAAPLAKPRPSMGTPTPSALSRSTSARPSTSIGTPVPLAHRRVASATLDQSTSRAVKARQTVNASPAPGEKENMKSDASRPASRTRVAVPA
ncbi:hypothetical protein MKEN_00442800 [Mycena kentingensis (nom. inval.)]|nr:hypothetical protein MKEN_00442800 [Mycena kentingensis (nom. inval.)]